MGFTIPLKQYPHPDGHDTFSNSSKADDRKILTTELESSSTARFTSLSGYAGFDARGNAVWFVRTQPAKTLKTATDCFECRVTQYGSGNTRFQGTLRGYTMPYRHPWHPFRPTFRSRLRLTRMTPRRGQ